MDPSGGQIAQEGRSGAGRGRGRGQGRGRIRVAGAPTRSRGRGGRGGRGNSSRVRGKELRDLAEKVKEVVTNGSWEEALALVAHARSSGLKLDGR